MKKIREVKGITLVALVITIIILLILAGITIKTLSNNGIFSKAEIAKWEYQKAALDEQMELFKYELEFDKNETLKSKMIKAGLIDENEINSNGLAKINNNEQFLALSNYNGLQKLYDETESGNDYTGKTIYLINDIDCGATFDIDTGELLSGQNFVPIKEFNGTLDGNNYEIKNLYIKKNNSEDINTALFAILKEDGIIKNLVISNSYINGYKDTGAFVGANYGQITNCINNCTIYGVGLTGGIAGRSYNLIENCINKGNIMATGQQTGGIVGNCDFGYSIKVINCKNYGDVNSTGDGIGGIVGGAWRDYEDMGLDAIIISNCSNYGNLNNNGNDVNYVGGICGYNRAYVMECYNYAIIKGKNYVGGIIGQNYYKNSIIPIISDCKNYGMIYGTGLAVGGICGINSSGNIIKCSNNGEIILNGDYGIGGICGIFNAYKNIGKCVIGKCYNNGMIRLESGIQAGGIVGYLGGSKDGSIKLIIKNCYNTGDIKSENSTYIGGICAFAKGLL